MRRTEHTPLRRHRLPVALALLAFCYPQHNERWPLFADAAASTAPPLTATSTVDQTSTTSSSPSVDPSDEERLQNQTSSSFLDRFDSHGPTLTLTLRDPYRTTLLGGGASSSGGSDRRSKFWSSKSSYDNYTPKKKPKPVTADDGTFGLSSKLAGLFHISPSASTDDTLLSSSTKSQFADGYMLDDGDIFLDPPSSSSSEGSSSSRGLFSIRDVGNGILGGTSSLSECVQNVHPELRYEVKSNTTPFPDSTPWLSGLSCGLTWSPFPVYKSGYPDGYGHKLMSVPHYIKCGARLSLPRISSTIRNWRSTNRGITNSFTMDNRPTTKDLDLGFTYRESTYSPTGGTLELLLGRSRQSLPPAKLEDGTAVPSKGINSQFLRQADDHRKNNHILVRLATGGRTQKTILSSSQNSLLSSIEYAKGSFRLPTPFFLRTKYNDRLSVSPSFDFVDEVARCVISGDVGSSGRTRAVLRLDSEDDSTLTIVRALDERYVVYTLFIKIIAPTISLNSGKIVYDYYLNLDGISGQKNISHRKVVNSSLRAHVDPTKGILLKWTDGIGGGRNAGGGGSCWVTECRIPLGTTAPGPLAADVRVGRRWVI
ncbi:hypothetical protein ACHAXR_004446 [Thalassiosira sp. AJA248-18]